MESLKTLGYAQVEDPINGAVEVNVQTAPPILYAAKEGHLDVLRRLLCLDAIYFNYKYGCWE